MSYTSVLVDEDEGTYICEGCEREVPDWFGAADELPGSCDDCWGKLSRTPAMGLAYAWSAIRRLGHAGRVVTPMWGKIASL